MRIILGFVTAFGFAIGIIGAAHADCSNQKCTVNQGAFYCDSVCASGSCPSATDTCPGHCTSNPGTVCVGNNGCPNGDTCNFSACLGWMPAFEPFLKKCSMPYAGSF